LFFSLFLFLFVDQRPSGIHKIVQACEAQNVKTFVACGGAGQLFLPDGTRLVEVLKTMPNMDWAEPITALHMAVQDIAFKSSIPTVFQIAPPGMGEGEISKRVLNFV
jgi:hypothetical protein